MPARPIFPPASTPTGKPDLIPTIHAFALGPFQTNCYIVALGRACWIIDASFEPEPLIDHVRAHNLRPAALILTHAHLDHIAGVDHVLHALGEMPLLIHADEREWLTDARLNHSASYGMPITCRPATGTIADGETLELGPSLWRVLETPGHSPGGICLFWERGDESMDVPPVLLAGDALFSGSIGRTDFSGSDHQTLLRSIREKLYMLPGETIVLPGHGPATTIARERETNPFVRA